MSISPTDQLSISISEPELVNRAARRDKRAFKILFRRYRDQIFALAYRKTRSREDAEDVVQESFIKAYEKLDTLRDPNAFTPWLYRVAQQTCIDVARRRTRLTRLYSKMHVEEPPDFTGKAHHASQSEMIQRIMAAIRKLDASQRLVVMMAFLEGMSYTEIAKHFGEPESTVRVRLHRALKSLREQLVRYITTTCRLSLSR